MKKPFTIIAVVVLLLVSLLQLLRLADGLGDHDRRRRGSALGQRSRLRGGGRPGGDGVARAALLNRACESAQERAELPQIERPPAEDRAAPGSASQERSKLNSLVLVEGDSDAAAVRALADRLGVDLDLHRVEVCSAGGVTNFSRVLADFVRTHPGAGFCGMYDVADERHVRRALANAAVPVAADESLESFGFFACVADLEDELIRALGTAAVERVLDAQAELASFRRFQAMPQHRGAGDASAVAPIPRDQGDTEDPLRWASRRSPGPGPIAAPARATGSPAARCSGSPTTAVRSNIPADAGVAWRPRMASRRRLVCNPGRSADRRSESLGSETRGRAQSGLGAPGHHRGAASRFRLVSSDAARSSSPFRRAEIFCTSSCRSSSVNSPSSSIRESPRAVALGKQGPRRPRQPSAGATGDRAEPRPAGSRVQSDNGSARARRRSV